MELHDSLSGKEASSSVSPAGGAKKASLDRLELKREWVQQAEEQQVEETLNLYVKAARQRIQDLAPAEPPEPAASEEELEAKSQELKLRQKCQDIAALMMVEELEDELEGE